MTGGRRPVCLALASIIVSTPMVLDPWFVMPILAIGMGVIALAIVSTPPVRSRLK